MAAAVFQLRGVAGVMVLDSMPPMSASMQLNFLQCLLAHIVSSVANYIDAEALLAHKYGMPVTSLEPILLQRTVRDFGSGSLERSPAPSRSSSRRSYSQRRSSSGSGIETPGYRRISSNVETAGTYML